MINFKTLKSSEKSMEKEISTKASSADLKKAGIDNSDCPANFDKKLLSFYKIQNVSSFSKPFLEKYSEELGNNQVDFGKYFTPNDGEMYVLSKKFQNAKFGTGDAELIINHINTHYNPIRRMIEGAAQNSSEKMNQDRIQKSFRSNEKLKNGVNILKDISWIIPHAFVTGLFMNYSQINTIIKNVSNFDAWNAYIKIQTDIPDDVKDFFYIKEGKCSFVEYFELNKHEFENSQKNNHLRHIMNTPESKKEEPEVKQEPEKEPETKQEPEKEPETKQEPEKEVKIDPAAFEHPQDDPPEEDTINNHIINFKEEKSFNDVVNKSKRENFVTLNMPITAYETKIPIGPSKPVEVKPEYEKEPEVKQEPKTVHDELVTIEDKSAEHVKAEVVDFSNNNRQWEYGIPKLDIFTKIVNDLGFHVFYEFNMNTYKGLINAKITSDNGNVIKNLTIDQYRVYGDNLRIITNENADFDLRKETFIPISMEDIIKKAITGTLSKEDKKLINSKLPKEIFNFRPKYNLLDRVDMCGLKSDGKDGLPFDQWKKFVENLSTIISDQNIPICRFRILEFINPDKFRLICDEEVIAHFNTGIFSEKSHAECVIAKTNIAADFSVGDYKMGIPSYIIYNHPTKV